MPKDFDIADEIREHAGTTVAGFAGWAIGGVVGAAALGGGYYWWTHRKPKCPSDADLRSILADIDSGKLSVTSANALATSMDKNGCTSQAAAIRVAAKAKLGAAPKCPTSADLDILIKGLDSGTLTIAQAKMVAAEFAKQGCAKESSILSIAIAGAEKSVEPVKTACDIAIGSLPDTPRKAFDGAPLPSLRALGVSIRGSKSRDDYNHLADLLNDPSFAGAHAEASKCIRALGDAVGTDAIGLPLDWRPGTFGYRDQTSTSGTVPPWLGGNSGKPGCAVCPIPKSNYIPVVLDQPTRSGANVPPWFRRAGT